MEIVVRGTLDVGGGRILKAGDVMVSEPMVLYGPHVAGPEGCTTMEIFSDHKGSQRVFFEGPSGELRESNLTSTEGAQEMLERLKA